MVAVTIVADTGPIIALAKVDQLALLETLFGTTAIPIAVMQELLAKQSPESRRIRQGLTAFIDVMPVDELPPTVKLATRYLDLGEAASVALAVQCAVPLLIDDANGRKAASRLGVTVIGTVGLVLRAKQVGTIAHALPLLVEMRRNGYWLSSDLLERASELAGEPLPKDLSE